MTDPELERRVRGAFERWNRGDHSFDPEWTDPEIEVQTAVAGLSGASYRGHEGLAQWIADMEEAFDEWRVDLGELEEVSPTRLLAIGTVHLRGRGSGVGVDQPCAWVLDHVDGVLTRFEPFLNRVEEARAAAFS
jgi:ketosteroid isomerase-like protein